MWIFSVANGHNNNNNSNNVDETVWTIKEQTRIGDSFHFSIQHQNENKENKVENKRSKTISRGNCESIASRNFLYIQLCVS